MIEYFVTVVGHTLPAEQKFHFKLIAEKLLYQAEDRINIEQPFGEYNSKIFTIIQLIQHKKNKIHILVE